MRETGVVLVTGAGGFVGSAVFRRLVDEVRRGEARLFDGTPVTRAVGTVRPGGRRDRLQEIAPDSCWEVVEADLSHAPSVRSLLRGLRPQAVLHLALDRQVFSPLPAKERYRLAIEPLEVLVRTLGETGGRRFVHTGSAWVLAPGDALDEDSPVRPAGPYAETKAWQDLRLPEVAGEAGISWLNLRLFNLFGRFEARTRLLPYLVRQLTRGDVAELAEGGLVRDFTDVDDVAGAYLCALRAGGGVCDRTYHIGSGRGTTLREFAYLVADITGNREGLRFGARRTPDDSLDRLVAEPTRARRLLGWSGSGPLAERVRSAVRWWLASGRLT